VPTLEHKRLPILVVDDDEPTLLMVRGMLEQGGYSNVESTTDPSRVPDMFAKTHPRLVLLDLHMPQMGGLELMAQLEAMTDVRHNVPFLVLTADESEETKRRALSLGARDFLTKPPDRIELLLRVRNLLRVQQLQDRLYEQNAHLQREQVGLLRDLRAMQAALVPEVCDRLGGLGVSVAYRPAEGPAAGGDFYDVFMSRAGNVAMMLGDASGHGPEALAHATLTRYTLRAYLQAGLEPRRALALAGRALVDPACERYATVAAGVYEPQTQTLTYALAGHPAPVLMEEGRVIHEPVTICCSPPIGWGLPTGRRQTRISLAGRAEACFFSDGLVEARRDGQVLGREHLREMLASLGPHPHAEQLLAAVDEICEQVPDDMVACVLSADSDAADERIHVEELEVDAELLGGSNVERFLCECALAPPLATQAAEQARQIVAISGAALIRVQARRDRSEVTVKAMAAV
jgi:phosphoserine phosphatase RsbU/P